MPTPKNFCLIHVITANRDQPRTPQPQPIQGYARAACVHPETINMAGTHSAPQPHSPHNREDFFEKKLLRKEVIQPHLPVRLPCYDFVPIADPTFDSSPNRPLASGVTNFHDVTGGVYKARERIHRSVADLRLLATPTSWGRVADPNPNYDRLSAIRSPSQARCALYRPL